MSEERALAQALELARATLGDARAWVVGGVVRDRVLGRAGGDLDLVIDGEPEQAARALGRAGRAACFALSGEFSGWRVVARDRAWQIDVERLRGESLEQDLRARDFTINAIAEPLQGGEPIDPLGGLGDLAARRLRMAGPSAFADDPLRVLRLVRMAVELQLQVEQKTRDCARAHAGAQHHVSPERVFIELRRIIGAQQPLRGIELLNELEVLQVVLPELEALRGVEQSQFHHRDVYGHTLEVLEQVVALQADPEAVIGAEHAEAVAALLREPLADELTRGDALRWGALLHDAAKPATRGVREHDGRVTFIGHDAQGAELARGVLGRLRASERMRAHVAALTRHHLRLGFLVHEAQPLARRSVFKYLRACDPVEVDVTLLSVADRLATRGERANEAIDAHMGLAHRMLTDALRWRAEGAPRALWRGDELAGELGIGLGPQVGELLQELAEARYAGEVRTREQALAYARERLDRGRGRGRGLGLGLGLEQGCGSEHDPGHPSGESASDP
ncbi:MAG TPA: HDIG domain-containing protein [Solirubrobacteraceae bacterium]|nr:HDIG domain-containing protein [Solirubrobacteraceae bacterium]